MGSGLSEARERQLLQAIHEVSSGNPHQKQHHDLDETRKRKAEEEVNRKDDDADDDEEGGGPEMQGVLHAVGELVSQSAHSVKEAVLGKESPQATNLNPTSQVLNPGAIDESAQESLLVHTAVHD